MRRSTLFFQHQLWSQEHPPPGGVFCLVESITKNPEKENPPRSTCYKFFEGGPLPPGSLLENPPNRKKTLGAGVSCDQLGQLNKLQHTATHCNTLQHTATHCNTLQHTILQYTAPKHYNIAHCNTLRHAATYCNSPENIYLFLATPTWAVRAAIHSKKSVSVVGLHNELSRKWKLERNYAHIIETHSPRWARHCVTGYWIASGLLRVSLFSRLSAAFAPRISNSLFVYGVATTCRLLKITGLFCKRDL